LLVPGWTERPGDRRARACPAERSCRAATSAAAPHRARRRAAACRCRCGAAVLLAGHVDRAPAAEQHERDPSPSGPSPQVHLDLSSVVRRRGRACDGPGERAPYFVLNPDTARSCALLLLFFSPDTLALSANPGSPGLARCLPPLSPPRSSPCADFAPRTA